MSEIPSNPRRSRKGPFDSICGARTRRGTPCQCKPVRQGGRCRLHGGASSGPKTAQGRAQSRENLKKALAVLNSPEYAEVRRRRAAKRQATLRRKALYRRLGVPYP